VQCIYTPLPAATPILGASSTNNTQINEGNDRNSSSISEQARAIAEEQPLDPMLELRLMHEWNTQVPQSFSTAWEFWQRQAPLIAFEHRYVLDSLLCLAALHAYRRQPQQWLALEGRMAPTLDEQTSTQISGLTNGQDIHQVWKLPSEVNSSETSNVRSRLRLDHLALEQQRGELLRVARVYFDRALAGQNKALPIIDAESGEACYLASICVTWAALFFLGEDQYGTNPWLNDPIQWARIAHGSRVVVSH
jgi:hypothetical protein